MTRKTINIESKEEATAKKSLEKKSDNDAKRLKRYLAMPDLSRAKDSPIYDLVNRIIEIPELKDLDVIKVPEIVRADVSFDLFNFPDDHPARSRSDTYYVNDELILRTHTTIMWYYYLKEEDVKKKMEQKKPVGSVCYGKVYRKDEIDKHHMNVFHQIDGWYLVHKSNGTVEKEDLANVLGSIAKAVFGQDVNYRLNKDYFPYTEPSLEMEVEIDGEWLEVVGSGIVRPEFLENLGVDPNEWTGWAFGFGLERLAIISMALPDIRLFWSDDERVKKQLKLGQKYEEVSKYPPAPRDISFVVDESFVPTDYFDLIREIGGDMIEEVKLLDSYKDDKKFGKGKTSYTYRVIYRSNDRTLTSEDVDKMQSELYEQTAKQYSAELR